ncbi:hypothetical protein F0L68_29335 [Solihabitans fulvus]|uniref:DUF1453 domain-containing protein n=1 Tax=Solihabitans fulvus TaxID=1892852 RepID=A0A5B2WWQ5_9PSEU|nr:hypothetical protein [Solihabitans fulvus]KAA2254886.1 hypothetical protein F0L68_29335 [Solihabitans fulvus]
MSNIQTVATIVIVALVLLRVIGKQLQGQPVSARSLFLVPAILLVVGAANAANVLSTASASEVVLLVVNVVLLVPFGLARGASIGVTVRDGAPFQQGTWLTTTLWVVSIAERFGASLVAHAMGIPGTLSSASLMATLGVSLVVQNSVVWWRAQKLGVPMPATARRS